MKCVHAVLFASFLSLVGCASTPRVAEPSAPQPKPSAQIRVQQVANVDAWEVTYRFDPPVAAVALRRPGQGLRARHWKVRGPASVRLVDHGEQDVLCDDAGAMLSEVRIEVPTYPDYPAKEYKPFIPYSSGGVLLYTGQFAVDAVPASACRGQETAPAGELVNRMTLVPRTGEHVILLEEKSSRSIVWTSDENGTYAFFGTLEPQRLRGIHLLLDPGFPAWLRDGAVDLMGKLSPYFTERTGHRLTFEPLVFLSYGAVPKAGSMRSKGGVLPGLVQLHYEMSSDEASLTPNHRLQALFTVAHETAHLWNGQLFRGPGGGGSWMHEGGANAFALRALYDLGMVTEPQVLERSAFALNTCLRFLGTAPLNTAHRTGRFDAFYSCGEVIALLTDASLREAQPPADVFGAWSALFRASRDGRYTEQRYYDALARLGSKSSVVADLRALVESPVQDPASALRATALHAGLELEASPEGVETKASAYDGVKHLVRQDCTRRRDWRITRSGVLLERLEGCSVLDGREGHTVVALDGVSLEQDLLGAVAAMRKACATRGEVRLGLSDAPKDVVLRCPNLPAFTELRLAKLPFVRRPYPEKAAAPGATR
jgi:hypothetical protein